MEKVRLEEPVQNVLRQETGAHGNTIWIVDLEIHPLGEGPQVPYLERRYSDATVAAPLDLLAQALADLPAASRRLLSWRTRSTSRRPRLPKSTAAPDPRRPRASSSVLPASGQLRSSPCRLLRPEPAPAPPDPAKIVVMVAGPSAPRGGRAERVRAQDRSPSRAQFRPEVEALDLSGLFVCEFGAVIREQRERRNVVLSDATRITEVLLQGNGFRRAGNHAKALVCYQELVDMDPSNRRLPLPAG